MTEKSDALDGQSLWKRVSCGPVPDGIRACPTHLEIAAYLEGTASAREQEAIEEHLPSCPVCMDTIRGVRLSADAPPIDMPTASTERLKKVLYADIAGASGQRQRRSTIWLSMVSAAACAAIVVGAALVHLYHLREPGSVSTGMLAVMGDELRIERDGRYVTAHTGMDILPNDTVIAGTREPARIDYGGGRTTVQLARGTKVRIVDGNGAMALVLAAGAIECDVAPQPEKSTDKKKSWIRIFDLSMGEVKRTIVLEEAVSGLSCGGGYLWALSRDEDGIRRIDRERGTVENTLMVSLPEPQERRGRGRDVSYHGGALWTLSNSKILDARDLEDGWPMWSFKLGSSWDLVCGAYPGLLWLGRSEGGVLRIVLVDVGTPRN